MTDDLLYELDGDGIAWVTFNRPQARNATSIDMIEALYAQLLRIEGDPSVRCVVLRGAGEHFMAGADLGALEVIAALPPQKRRVAMQQRIGLSAPIFSILQRLPQPVVASVRGSVAGGGMGFLLACDLAIAASDAKFVLAQVKVGLSPDGSSSWHLPRSVGMKRAKQLALLGEMLDAPTALAWGLVNWVAAPDEVHAQTQRVARQLATSAARSMAQAKRLLNASAGNPLAEQVALEAQAMGLCAEVDDFAEGLRSVRERRAPSFQTTDRTGDKA